MQCSVTNASSSYAQRDGTTTSAKDVPSLQVHVQDVEYVPRTGSTDFPHYGKATKWPVTVQDDC